MTRFAFIIHPIDARRDVSRKYWIARFLPLRVIEWFLKKKSPMVLSKITGVKSITGAETEGWFIGCPLTPKMMLEMPLEEVYDKIVACCDLAADLGADIVGLGAFTAVIGDGGETISKRSRIAVTTGNSYTVASAIEGTLKAAELMGIKIEHATLAVVGATGSIGKTCAQMLSTKFAQTILIGRDLEKTEQVAQSIGAHVSATTDITRLKEADVIITVTSSETDVVLPEYLKVGSVICDVARPRDVSIRVQQERDDVLVIEGGVVSLPSEVNFGFDFGFPKNTAYACMSETMMLALENRAESFTIGKDVSEKQVMETIEMAKRHGFTLSGFRSFEKALSPENIERVKAAVKRKREEIAKVGEKVQAET